MEIHGDNLYTTWLTLNRAFLSEPEDDGWLIPGRDFTMTRYNVNLHTESMWLPESTDLFNKDKRIALLAKRYIDPDLWGEGVERLFDRRTRATGSQPNTFVVMFHRRATNERKVPAGGGCLVSMNFTWFKKRWHLHILSRASEITIRLLGDMYFLDYAVQEVVKQAEMRKWDPENVSIDWTLLLPSQMKSMVPLFLHHDGGDDNVLEYMSSTPGHEWQRTIQDHFWREFIYPNKINWAQRRKWSEVFAKRTEVAWAEHEWADNYPYPVLRKRDMKSLIELREKLLAEDAANGR